MKLLLVSVVAVFISWISHDREEIINIIFPVHLNITIISSYVCTCK